MRDLPDNPSWLLRKAVEYDRRWKHGRAHVFSRLKLLFKPDDYWALCCYANSLYHVHRDGSIDKMACSLYRKAISIKPDEVLAHVGLAGIHYFNFVQIWKESSLFPGMAELRLLEAKDPDEGEDVRKHLWVAYADDHCANWRVAVKYYERGASLTEDTGEKVEFLTKAADIRCRINNDDGIVAFEAIISLDPDNIQSHYCLGCLYAAKGRRDEALKELEFINGHAPEVAEEMKSESVFQSLGASS